MNFYGCINYLSANPFNIHFLPLFSVHYKPLRPLRLCGEKVYPRATSSTIISTNPSIAPIVAGSVFLSDCDSGISSSTTT